MLNLQSKRGYPFNCNYCSYPHTEGQKHRLIEPDEVARTAIELQATGEIKAVSRMYARGYTDPLWEHLIR